MLIFNYLLISLVACSQVALSTGRSNSSLCIEDKDSIISSDMCDKKFDSESAFSGDSNTTSGMGYDENIHH